MGQSAGIPPENWDEQLSRMDRYYATRVDLEAVKGDLKTEIARLESRLIKYILGLVLASITAASAIALLVQRLTE